MDDWLNSIGFLAPLLFGLVSWLAVQFRKSPWAQKLVREVGFERREHEQEWEFQRRIGSYWLTLAAVFGLVTYLMAQHLLQHGSDPPVWEAMTVFVVAVFSVWSIANSIRALWASRRDA